MAVKTSRTQPAVTDPLTPVPAPRHPDERVPPLSVGPKAITAAADDFGHIIHRVPAAVARPRDTDEVAALIRYAISADLTVTARGTGHSVNGQAQCDGGIVCDLTGLNEIRVIGSDHLSAGAGAPWSAVLAAALEHGLTLPVLTDYLELSVGGTLSAGGIGGTSHQHGPQVDHVRELEVVTSTGDIITCSPTSDTGVFSAALAGYGRAGIITRATIPLIPAPDRARVVKIRCPDLDTLIAWQRLLARDQRFGYLEGQIELTGQRRWKCVLEAAAFYTGQPPCDARLLDGLSVPARALETEDADYLAFCHRMIPGIRLLAEMGEWYRQHPWLSVFLPCEAVGQYASRALAKLTPGTLGQIPMLLYPLRRGPLPVPGLSTPAPDVDGLFYTFSILRTTNGGTATLNAVNHNHILAHAATEAGGTIYPISVLSAWDSFQV